MQELLFIYITIGVLVAATVPPLDALATQARGFSFGPLGGEEPLPGTRVPGEIEFFLVWTLIWPFYLQQLLKATRRGETLTTLWVKEAAHALAVETAIQEENERKLRMDEEGLPFSWVWKEMGNGLLFCAYYLDPVVRENALVRATHLILPPEGGEMWRVYQVSPIFPPYLPCGVFFTEEEAREFCPTDTPWLVWCHPSNDAQHQKIKEFFLSVEGKNEDDGWDSVTKNVEVRSGGQFSKSKEKLGTSKKEID